MGQPELNKEHIKVGEKLKQNIDDDEYNEDFNSMP
jgi:hypothetical protein